MPANPSPTASLPCEQCGYMNEPERVYCHNCGAKLDRSLLPKEQAKSQESQEAVRKRIKKMTNPAGNWVGREVKMAFQTLAWSAFFAAVIQIARQPDGVPDPKGEPSGRLVNSDFAEALESPAPRAIAFSEADVNQYFKSKLKAKEGMIPGISFTRAYVNMRPGALRIAVENSVWGYPVFYGIDYHLEVKDGKFTTTVVGGNFGRLAVDPRLMQYAEPVFDSLGTALSNERKQMDKLSSVAVEDKRIDLVTKGAAAAAP